MFHQVASPSVRRSELLLLLTFASLMTSCFLHQILTHSTLAVIVTCPTLCPLQSSLLECSWICSSARACVPHNGDVPNEILNRQCDLHANDFALCGENTSGIRTLLFAFPFLSERVTLRSMLVVSSRQFMTLQLSTSVSRRWRGVNRVTSGTAGSIGISTLFLRSE